MPEKTISENQEILIYQTENVITPVDVRLKEKTLFGFEDNQIKIAFRNQRYLLTLCKI